MFKKVVPPHQHTKSYVVQSGKISGITFLDFDTLYAYKHIKHSVKMCQTLKVILLLYVYYKFKYYICSYNLWCYIIRYNTSIVLDNSTVYKTII